MQRSRDRDQRFEAGTSGIALTLSICMEPRWPEHSTAFISFAIGTLSQQSGKKREAAKR